MNALALTGLITILAAVSAAAVAGYLAGYNDRALREVTQDLAEVRDEIEHAEDVRDDYASATSNVDTSDDADLDGMLHDSAESALGTDGVSA